MIDLKTWGLILTFAIPLIISPGPGNTILAAAGAKFGVRGTVPFWLGFEAGNFVWCLIYGFGLSQLVMADPAIFTFLKWAGTAYVLYLAWGFFKSASMSEQESLGALTFLDGFISLSLNPKVHSMILVMFSQFLNPALPIATQVIQISVVFVVVGLACHFVWIYGGQIIFNRFNSRLAVRVQGIVLGMCMLVVAGFMAFA